MTYQALYRVWRSQRFSDIVGQQVVTQTLKNALSQHKTSHAYLFTGPRGTGKTSAAKIFAKAINCPNQKDGEPCNECDICQAITEGRLNDVIEIDAASNNGVDEIRDIREKVKYAPTLATYKVYIIDEVHMLSTGAFNALLKTLEEPPKNVLFILATTEPHKIPATIISRTQRFDFKRISSDDIVNHLSFILSELAITFEKQSLYIIARSAEGGMRDALSLLDQALSFGDGALTDQDALQVTGSLTTEMMDDYLLQCSQNQVESALKNVQSILAEGKESSRFLEDILLYCRDLLIYQQAADFLLLERGYVTEGFKNLTQQLSAEEIYQYIEILNQTQQQLKQSTHTNIYLEVATVKLANINKQKSIAASGEESGVVHSELEELKEQLANQKKAIKELQKNQTTESKQAPVTPKPVSRPSSYRLPKEQVYQVLRGATRERLRQTQDVWEDLLQFLTVTQRAMLKASQPVAASDDGLIIAFDYEIVCQRANEDESFKELVTSSLAKLIKIEFQAIFIPKESWGMLRQEFLEQNPVNSNPAETIEEHDELELLPESQEKKLVDTALEMFGEQAVEVIDE